MTDQLRAAPPAGAPRVDADPEPDATHGCVRCGRPLPLTVAMCDTCNPSGLPQPASSQVHGTVFVGIVAAVAVMAIVAKVLTAGTGPFEGRVERVVSDPAGLLVTLAIENRGQQAGSAACRLIDPSVVGAAPDTAFVQSPRIEGGSSATFQQVVTTLGTEPRELVIDCSR